MQSDLFVISVAQSNVVEHQAEGQLFTTIASSQPLSTNALFASEQAQNVLADHKVGYPVSYGCNGVCNGPPLV